MAKADYCYTSEILKNNLEIWNQSATAEEANIKTEQHFNKAKAEGDCISAGPISQFKIDKYGSVVEEGIAKRFDDKEPMTLYLIKLHDPSGRRPTVYIWNILPPKGEAI
jgi:hypothetical protein